ncbi:uncharacterized protein LOC134843862 isoform X2 [Symsagittifera roscoffensis]|uniref:uncharacterized protein LOC134843862 isoform X2 n=1 Tax=Symsagittifera roscoffensis TaxID=84072 RepID=UPI00307C040E
MSNIPQGDNPSPGLTWTFCVMGLLSIAGCGIYLYCFFFLQTTRSYARKLVAFIALTEGLSIMGNVSGILYMTLASEHEYSAFGGDGYPTNCTPAETQPPSDQFCQVQAYFTNFFSISSFVFNSGLAILMLQITWSNRPSSSVYYTINYFAFIIPLVVTTTVAAKGLYGFSVCTTGGWCWLRELKTDDNMYQDGWTPPNDAGFWQTFAGKLWEILTEVIMIGSYIALRLVLWYKEYQCRRRGASQEVIQTLEAVESLYKRLLWTPFVFFCCYIIGTIRSYVLLYEPTSLSPGASTTMSFIHGVGNNAPGFCNFVIFVLLHEQMRKELARDLAAKWGTLINFLLCRTASMFKSGSGRTLYDTPKNRNSSRNKSQSALMKSSSQRRFGRQ